MKKINGMIFAILSSIGFGLMPIFAKVSYNNGLNPTSVLTLRFLSSAAILFIYFKFKGISIKVTKKQLIRLMLIGVFGYSVTCQMLFISYDYIDVGLATTVHFIYPAFVCIIGYLFMKEKMTMNKMLALLLSSAGVYALIAFEIESINITGAILALLSGLTYGMNVIALSSEEIRNVNNAVTTFYCCIFSGITMLIYGLISNELILKINTGIIMSVIGISLVSTILSMILLFKAIKIVGSTTASILGTFEPLVGITFGVILFGENLNTSTIIGTVLILLSVIILSIGKDTSREEIKIGEC